MNWLIGIVVAVIVVALWMWLIVITEGVFLGRRLVVWLYDITAFRYDRVKEYELEDETVLVVEPVLMLARGSKPVILDVATGTGRVPYYLLGDARFEGSVVAIDASQKMLEGAKEKMAEFSAETPPRHTLDLQPAYPLPYNDSSFDGVTCLEALEFFPSDKTALAEMVRVLKPGGFLIATRRKEWEAYAFVWRYRSAENMRNLLDTFNLTDIHILPWQSNYDLVIGRKPLSTDLAE